MTKWSRQINLILKPFPDSLWNKYEYFVSQNQLYIYDRDLDMSRITVVLDKPRMTKLLFLLGAFDD